MKKAIKIIAVIVSVMITLLVLIKFISLLDFISFDFGVVGDFCKIGWNIPGWLLGFMGCALDFYLSGEWLTYRTASVIFRAQAVFCLVVALLDLLTMYLISMI